MVPLFGKHGYVVAPTTLEFVLPPFLFVEV